MWRGPSSYDECYTREKVEEGTYDEARAIGVDLDDVLRQTYRKILQLTHPGKDSSSNALAFEGLVDWNLDRLFGEPGFGLRMWNHHNREISLDSEPMAGAAQTLKELRRRGWQVVIVTSLFDQSIEFGKTWLTRHGMEYDALLVTRQKSKHFRGLCLLDDGPHNLDSFRGGATTPVCFDRPWNRGERWEGLRVHSWDEFEQWVLRTLLPPTAQTF